MERADWLAANEAAIRQRLRGLLDKPPGILFFEPSGDYIVVAQKTGSLIRMWLASPSVDLVQSKLDLDDPLGLVSPYTQAIMLSLAWVPNPGRVYLIGLGGGRIPQVLHHYLPEAIIECTEVDPVVTEAARRVFGLQLDERLRVAHQDGRAYLAAQPEDVRYDLIIVDAFAEKGDDLAHLATREFCQLCQAHLTGEGMVVTNMLQDGPLYAAKVKTLQSLFSQCYLWSQGRGNAVVLASNGPPLTRTELLKRVRAIQAHHHFSFPLVKRAHKVMIGPEIDDSTVPSLSQAHILVDSR